MTWILSISYDSHELAAALYCSAGHWCYTRHQSTNWRYLISQSRRWPIDTTTELPALMYPTAWIRGNRLSVYHYKALDSIFWIFAISLASSLMIGDGRHDARFRKSIISFMILSIHGTYSHWARASFRSLATYINISLQIKIYFYWNRISTIMKMACREAIAIKYRE